MANVFISHRSTDAVVAGSLASEIRNAGHDVWFDEWNINLGDSIVARIDSGLAGATYVILCCSADGVHTPWMGREWMSTLARQLNGKSVRLLPVLLSGKNVPAILEDIKYADLTSDWRKGVSELLSAIK